MFTSRVSHPKRGARHNGTLCHRCPAPEPTNLAIWNNGRADDALTQFRHANSINGFADPQQATNQDHIASDISNTSIPPLDWNAIRPRFTELYDVYKCTLASTMQVMEQEFGFYASKPQFKNKVKEWGLKKNVKRKEMKHLKRIRDERKQQDPPKATLFWVKGRGDPVERLARYELDALQGKRTPLSTASSCTPDDITYRTPSASQVSEMEISPHDGKSLTCLTDYASTNGQNVYIDMNDPPSDTQRQDDCITDHFSDIESIPQEAIDKYEALHGLNEACAKDERVYDDHLTLHSGVGLCVVRDLAIQDQIGVSDGPLRGPLRDDYELPALSEDSTIDSESVLINDLRNTPFEDPNFSISIESGTTALVCGYDSYAELQDSTAGGLTLGFVPNKQMTFFCPF